MQVLVGLNLNYLLVQSLTGGTLITVNSNEEMRMGGGEESRDLTKLLLNFLLDY